MVELANWWPGRGKNPHTCGWKPMKIRATKKDLPAPKKYRSAVAEKGLIDRCLDRSLKLGTVKPIKRKKGRARFKRFTRPAPRPLVGSWQVWYQVSDVAKLTLEQADRVLKGCVNRKKGKQDHHDNWIMYQARTLQVDITYPLTRGVRLMVKPVQLERTACRRCREKRGKRYSRTDLRMSPGILMWAVAQEYVRIYKAHKKYGVWGHGIGDLGFERIDIDKDGVVKVFIGS